MIDINTIICGDAIEQLKPFPDNYFGSVVTDPPAGISFMGKKWDDDKGGCEHWIKWLSEVFIEAKRTLKPGGHALVWSLPRTSHWTGMALEDAGFEVRDIVHHVFGSGLPKSLNIGKSIDKFHGNEIKSNYIPNFKNNDYGKGMGGGKWNADCDDSKMWEGWGSALKPAVENWWLVRKPISENTIAENVLKWGVGGLNIDDCRIPTGDIDKWYSKNYPHKTTGYNESSYKIDYQRNSMSNTKGRFPANLIHDGSDEVLAEFAKAGMSKSIRSNRVNGIGIGYHGSNASFDTKRGFEDSVTPARFFYCAKPSRAEKDRGLEGMVEKPIPYQEYRDNAATTKSFVACYPDGTSRPMNRMKNNHPTVKAQALMEYLIKLITPPNEIVLDMFAGSGSTLIAAKKLGHPYIGIEIDPEYCEIARRRITSIEPPKTHIVGNFISKKKTTQH